MKDRSAATLVYFLKQKDKSSNYPKRPFYKRRNFKLVVSFLFLAILLGLSFWFYVSRKPFDVSKVAVEGPNRFVSLNDVEVLIRSNVLGKNIFLLDRQDLKDILLNNFLALKEVNIRRVFPNSIFVQVEERVPVCLINPKESENFYFVDNDGFVLGIAKKEDTNLPVIVYLGRVEVGRFVQKEIVSYYFDLIKALDNEKVPIQKIDSFPRYVIVYTNDGVSVLLPNKGSALAQVKTLVKILEAFKVEGKKPRKVDLRFDKVIVEFDK